MKALQACFAAALIAGAALPAYAEVYTNEDGDQVKCVEKEVQTKDGHPIAAPLAGAVVGGVVGNQIGGGKGNDIATAAGAVGGAVVGKKYNDNRTEDSRRTREVCKRVD